MNYFSQNVPLRFIYQFSICNFFFYNSLIWYYFVQWSRETILYRYKNFNNNFEEKEILEKLQGRWTFEWCVEQSCDKGWWCKEE